MQTVWSRVAQTRCLCNCPTCVSATNAVARRTSTATARRKIRVGDVFTVFASSLAATATLIDSTKKDRRRAHWDRVIGEARAQVQATEIQQQSRLASLAQISEEEAVEEHGLNDSHTITGTRLKRIRAQHSYQRNIQSRVDKWADLFDWAIQQEEARAASGFQDWRGLSLSLLQSLSSEQLQQLLSNKTLLRRFYGGPDCAALVDEASTYDLSAKKKRTLEYSVAKLVLRLLLYSTLTPPDTSNRANNFLSLELPLAGDALFCGFDWNNCTNDSLPATSGAIIRFLRESEFRESISEKELVQNLIQDGGSIQRRLANINSHLKALSRAGKNVSSEFFERFESPPAPRYCGSSTTKYDRAKTLSYALKKILDRMSCEQDKTPSISKICFNLLSSQTPPNIHSYNMLLVQFCRLDKSEWVQAVWTSMRESHIRPNEITHSTLLRYYTMTNNSAAFIDYLCLMEGHSGGLAIAASDQIIPPLTSHRYRFFGSSQGKAAEKARMNGEVYESLIIGALRFFGAQTAMQYYRDMISEGWRSSVDLLTSILKYCCHRFDWEAGVSVWTQIKTKAEGANQITYQMMLRLCEACKQQSAFDQILQEGVDQGVLPPSVLETRIFTDPKYPLVRSEDVKTSTFSERNGVRLEEAQSKAILAVRAMPTLGDTTSSPSTMSDDISESGNAPFDQHSTDMRPACELLEQQLGVLFADISKTASRVVRQQSQLRAAGLANADLMRNLAVKVKQLNEADSHKMDGREYQKYNHGLQGRLRKNGQVISRTFYERYKSDVISRLEKQDRNDGTIRLDGYEPSGQIRKYGPLDDNYVFSVPDEKALPPTSSNIPHPTTWSNLDAPPTQLSAQSRS